MPYHRKILRDISFHVERTNLPTSSPILHLQSLTRELDRQADRYLNQTMIALFELSNIFMKCFCNSLKLSPQSTWLQRAFLYITLIIKTSTYKQRNIFSFSYIWKVRYPSHLRNCLWGSMRSRYSNFSQCSLIYHSSTSQWYSVYYTLFT